MLTEIDNGSRNPYEAMDMADFGLVTELPTSLIAWDQGSSE
jgi:hypothetical protein